MAENISQKTYWDCIYATKAPDAVSWRQQKPGVSLALIDRLGLPLNAAIIDVGGGASTLVDHLRLAGFADIAVLDISEYALLHAKARLGDKDAARVEWIVADVTRWRPHRRFDLWHDRAVLHFLTAPADQDAYAKALAASLKPGGSAVVGGFAPGGPNRCSGLDVVHHDAESLGALLGPSFKMVEIMDEIHRTPQGVAQPFRFHVLQYEE